MYLITQLAKKVNVSIQNIRKYERMGLIKGRKNKGESGKSFVYYDTEAVDVLEIITACQSIGLNMDEITEFVKGWYGKKMSNLKRVKILNHQLLLLDKKMEQIRDIHHKVQLLSDEISKFV